ncbi:MAG: potassium channel family protein [Ilumatobacter fluminis]|uniref:Ion channel n=1 Tax=Ilumatobacter fluminis TaxID=467091 RepID=A0A4R7I5Y9_9ACTN|nr:potassium channel family protein [Ilumatobacter fluminis]TDT18429.1 ion channel [Ilumatobacter fluminis]
MVDEAGPGRTERVSRRIESRFFDETSPSLDRFGSLLALTVASVVALSLIDVHAIENTLARGIFSIILSTVTGITLVLGFRSAGVARRGRRIAEAMVVLAFVTSVISLALEQAGKLEASAWQPDRPSPLWVLIAVITPFAVIHRLIAHRTVTVRTLAGAIAAYLLIAIAFCYLYLYVDALTDDSFFAQERTIASWEFMYFSLVTITTLGYGDLSPDNPVGGLLATSEAVLGQVYLVTFVAMVVGLLIQQRDD